MKLKEKMLKIEKIVTETANGVNAHAQLGHPNSGDALPGEICSVCAQNKVFAFDDILKVIRS